MGFLIGVLHSVKQRGSIWIDFFSPQNYLSFFNILNLKYLIHHPIPIPFSSHCFNSSAISKALPVVFVTFNMCQKHLQKGICYYQEERKKVPNPISIRGFKATYLTFLSSFFFPYSVCLTYPFHQCISSSSSAWRGTLDSHTPSV